jgi:hypothetical protein
MKGKTLTVAQKKLAQKNGITDIDNWLYAKTVTRNPDGEYHSSKHNEKCIYLVIINKNTGTMKEIPMA